MDYYDSKDLGRFAEVGKFRGELMEKFFAYYNEVTGQDGALSRREKALIALAVAHAKHLRGVDSDRPLGNALV